MHAPRASYVLIDWAKPHASADSAMRERGVRVARVKIDLRHLWLGGVAQLWQAPTEPPTSTEQLQPAEPPAKPPTTRLAIAKHLCGCATDFALRSIVDAAKAASSTAGGDTAESEAAGGGGGGESGTDEAARDALMRAIAIATCCHHRCTWDAYVSRPFMQRHGIDRDDFALLTLLSSWATASPPNATPPTATPSAPTPPAPPAGEAEEHSAAPPEAARLERCLGGQLDGASRIEIGRMCKRLLDAGRLSFLRQHGYAGTLQPYVPETVSPENVLLVAEPIEEPAGPICVPCG